MTPKLSVYLLLKRPWKVRENETETGEIFENHVKFKEYNYLKQSPILLLIFIFCDRILRKVFLSVLVCVSVRSIELRRTIHVH